jgi:hypothetical protein
MHPELKAQYQLLHSILHKIDDAYLEAGKKIIRNAEELFREAELPVDAKPVTHEDPSQITSLIIKVNIKPIKRFTALLIASNS